MYGETPNERVSVVAGASGAKVDGMGSLWGGGGGMSDSSETTGDSETWGSRLVEGGVGNVCRICSALGGVAWFICSHGDDADGGEAPR